MESLVVHKMSYSIYIPPPFPFPNQWNTVFSSSQATPWLCPSTPLVYPSINSNNLENMETMEKQTSEPDQVEETKQISETTTPMKYKVIYMLLY